MKKLPNGGFFQMEFDFIPSSKRGLNEDESRIISFIGAIFGKFVSLYIQKPFFY